MVATVRLDSKLEETLNSMVKKLDKKKSDVIRDAINFYSKSINNSKKDKILKAINKTQVKDFYEYKDIESSLDDGI